MNKPKITKPKRIKSAKKVDTKVSVKKSLVKGEKKLKEIKPPRKKQTTKIEEVVKPTRKKRTKKEVVVEVKKVRKKRTAKVTPIKNEVVKSPVKNKRKPKKIKKTKIVKELPRILVCILTGQKVKIGYPQLLKQYVKLKFDSLEDYQQYYVCKDARKLLLEGKTESDIRKQYNCNDTTVIPFRILKCYAKKFKSKDFMERKRRRNQLKEMMNNRSSISTLGNTDNHTQEVKFESNSIMMDTCWRPNLYLDNDHACDCCNLFEKCNCKIKKISKRELLRIKNDK